MENNIYLDVLSFENLETIRKWRNEVVKNGIFRTSYLLTYHMQKKFFDDVINNRNSNSRYWGIFLKTYDNDDHLIHVFIGYTGLDKIEWENGLAEIGLMISHEYVGLGYGSKSLSLVLNEAFNNMRLQNIYGECYKCNPNIEFWEKMIEKYKAYSTILPSRKFFNGYFFDSMYFNFNSFVFGEIN